MTTQVETRNASLDTLAVTIRALHVSGKQMTLAVFRQLPVMLQFYDTSGNLLDLEYWGTVRYRFDYQHVWVICASDGVLYRAPTEYLRDRPRGDDLVKFVESLPQLFIAV